MPRERRRRRKHHNDCRGKARFGSLDEAHSVEPSQFPYLCGKCGCWHLTTHPKR